MADVESMRRRIDEAIRLLPRGDGDGVMEALDRLCRAVDAELDVMGAAVAVLPGVGAHAVPAASSEVARRLEDAQFGVGEGPTREAFETRRPVLVADLDARDLLRWPGWTPTALEVGVHAVYAFPLHVGASIFGVLTLYVGDAPRLDTPGLQAALVFSEIATELLLDGSMPGEGHRLDGDLDASLDTHGYVYQAQGMVMVELGITLHEALARLRAHAWATGIELSVLAAEIVAGRVMLSRDVPPKE